MYWHHYALVIFLFDTIIIIWHHIYYDSYCYLKPYFNPIVQKLQATWKVKCEFLLKQMHSLYIFKLLLITSNFDMINYYWFIIAQDYISSTFSALFS